MQDCLRDPEPQANKKFFGAAVFQKMLPRCGRVAHICEANCICNKFFLLQLHVFKTFKFRQSCIMSIKVASSDKATGQLQHAGRQKQGWNPFCRMRKTVFPKSSVSHETIECPCCNCSPGTVARYLFAAKISQGGAVLFAPPRKSGRFSHHPFRVPKAWHRDFAACGQQSGLLALNLANIFEKLLDQKFLFLCFAQMNQPFSYLANALYV